MLCDLQSWGNQKWTHEMLWMVDMHARSSGGPLWGLISYEKHQAVQSRLILWISYNGEECGCRCEEFHVFKSHVGPHRIFAARSDESCMGREACGSYAVVDTSHI